jgi:hypothetical protein
MKEYILHDSENCGHINSKILQSLPEEEALKICSIIAKKYNAPLFRIIYEIQYPKTEYLFSYLPLEKRDEIRKLLYEYGIIP